jgi:hypothetical protein
LPAPLHLEFRRAAFAPLFCLYAVVLAACATSGAAPSSDENPPGRSAPAASRYNLTGYSEAFKQGYADACAGRRRDGRLKTDSDYQMGWSDGQSLCRR